MVLLLLAPTIAALDVIDTTIGLRLASSVGRVRCGVAQLVQRTGQLGAPIFAVDIVICWAKGVISEWPFTQYGIPLTIREGAFCDRIAHCLAVYVLIDE
jgi:hypothetical protein